MKVILIAKNKDSAKYHDVAILIEPLGNLEDYQERQLIGVRDGKVTQISEAIDKRNAYFIFDVKISVNYQKWVIDFIRSQVGKKASKPRWWHRIFRTPESVQARRKAVSVWTSSELIAAALAKAGSQGTLWRKKQPQEITPEMISLSPMVFFRKKVTVNGN
jgi:hypothetical protein